jgi:hypothetical protein
MQEAWEMQRCEWCAVVCCQSRARLAAMDPVPASSPTYSKVPMHETSATAARSCQQIYDIDGATMPSLIQHSSRRNIFDDCEL